MENKKPDVLNIRQTHPAFREVQNRRLTVGYLSSNIFLVSLNLPATIR